MNVTSPKVASTNAILVVIAYLLAIVSLGSLNYDMHLVFMLAFSTLIGIAAFNFAIREIKETEGVLSAIDLSVTKLFGAILFAILIAIGYDGLVFVIAEIFTGQEIQVSQAFDISKTILQIIIGFLIVYPFFQFTYLARPGEDSAIPAQFPIEKTLESMTNVVKSPFVASVIVYGLTYVLPILILQNVLSITFQLALLLWALILPLISIGALAGAGLGEDLIRLKMVRKLSDWPKLGLPKINLKDLKFKTGGLLLVLFAFQALITTAFFGFRGLGIWLGILEPSPERAATWVLFLTLFNKGRGAFKELNEVWNESGFKVNVFQLFLPVYVFLGVILSSALEVFVQNAFGASGALNEFNLGSHIGLASFILVVQNFVLIFTAIWVWRNAPAAAERRLIKEVPEFYGDDVDGYLYVYKELEDEQSVVNLLNEVSLMIRKNPKQAKHLKGLIRETLQSKHKNIQTAAADALLTIVENLEEYDPEYFEMAKISLDSQSVGARIYGTKIIQSLLQHLEGVEKDQAIDLLQSYVNDPDPVVSWDSSLVLFRILRDDEEYRAYILAGMIKTLNTTDKDSSINATDKFFKKIANESSKLGQMAISTLATSLASGDNERPHNIISGIKSLLRGNPRLAEDLINQVAIGIESSDLEYRKNTYQVLTNMAQYGTGREEEILDLIVTGINDDSTEIQEIAYDALEKEIVHSPNLVNRTFTIILSKYERLDRIPLLGALNVLKSIISITDELTEEIFKLVSDTASSTDPEVRAETLNLLGKIGLKEKSLTEQIYRIAQKSIDHKDPKVRQEAISTLGEIVSNNEDLARVVYREIKDARNDESYIVQLASIEALGHVAAATDEYTDEIYDSLHPLLDDEDWQVRLASFNGLVAAIQNKPSLIKELENITVEALFDPDRTIREEALDVVNWLTYNHRRSVNVLLDEIIKRIRRVDSGIQETLASAMEIIAGESALQVPKVLNNIDHLFDKQNNNVRFATLEALKASLEKLKSTTSITIDAKRSLNSMITTLLKAANHSDAGVRRTAYEAITEICAAIPEIKAANRGRIAIKKALEMEEDVGLLEYLEEEAQYRVKKPLDMK